jgi:zinc/manganese transport system substrate-binding protein
MKIALRVLVALFVAWTSMPFARATDGKIPVVAAENFYGDLARQIGGDRVSVISILSNPQQDPHLFEVSPSVVRALAGAQIVLYNGAGYDPWMDNLLKVTPKASREVIVAAQIVEAKPDAHAADYAARSRAFLASLKPLDEKIAALRASYGGVPVTATEPIFGDMAAALHLTMLNQRFQLAVMNNTEPSAADFAAFERSLRMHSVRVLFYNKQASDNLVRHVVDLARASNIPVVGITETCPPGLSYQDWMIDELGQTENALARPAS